MPDANGNFKGQGWTPRRAAAWDRIFGSKPTTCPPDCRYCLPGCTHDRARNRR